MWACAIIFSRDKSNGFDSFLALEQSEDMLVDEIIKVIRIVVIVIIIRKGFEPRSNISWLKKIIWVIGVLGRTVVSDWCFTNLWGSQLRQSQVVVLVSWKFKNPAYQFKNPAHQENSKTPLTRVFEFSTNTTTWLWRWLPHRLLKCQSLTTVLLRTPITQMILFNRGIIIIVIIIIIIIMILINDSIKPCFIDLLIFF